MNVLNFFSYPRGAVVTLLGVAWTLIMSVVVFSGAMLTRSARVTDFLVNIVWCRPILWLGGVRVVVRGDLDGLATPKGFLLLFNHSSFMDILALFAYFPRSFRFGAKIELFRVPLFGAAMRACGILPIDRANRNKVLKVYREAIARVERGECFALAPEGTRQNEPRLGSFKRGPFEFAIQAQAPIVPVVLAGAFAVLPRKRVWLNVGRWRRTILIEVTPRVETAGFTLDTASALQVRVREQMLEAHERLYAELGPQN